jgi:Pectate lyase superfamily protein
MSSTNFIDQVTPIVSTWLNDVNATTYVGLPAETAARVAADAAEVAARVAADAAEVAALAASSGSSLVGTISSGTGAVSRTVQSKLRDTVSVKDFGAIGDGITDDTAAIQNAINAASNVYVPAGTYMCGNILMKSNLRITGESAAAILKLLPNATTYSINGSVVDTNGRYPGNVLCSTLNHTGGIWYDAGVRAKDQNNSTYIYENVIIENLTLDGNKANNQVGDVGLNASAMGAGVNIMLCKNVTVQNCNIINNRLDGIQLGYTLCGGSDYCNIIGNNFGGNQRTNIAQITGKYNSFIGNSGTNTTGGTGVGAGASLDIEPNFTDEINNRHSVVGNRLGGSFAIVSRLVSNMQNTVATGNVWIGGLSLYGTGMTAGCVIDGDTFIASSSTQDWLNYIGPNTAIPTDAPVLIKNCSVTGFAHALKSTPTGGQSNIVVEGCSFNVEAFGTLTRAYRAIFRNNVFNLSGNADATSVALSNTLGGTVPFQGQVEFSGNKFYGVSNATFFSLTRDSSWTVNDNDFLFIDNDVQVTGATYTFAGATSLTISQNRIENFKPINIVSVASFQLLNNYIAAVSAENLFANQTGTFNDSEVSNNEFEFVSVNLIRPKDVTVCSNRFIAGNITIVYSFTASGVGRSHIAFNYMTAKTVISNPFIVTTGGSFSTANFLGNDQYNYNTYVGYTAGASIAAAMAGVYTGTFG